MKKIILIFLILFCIILIGPIIIDQYMIIEQDKSIKNSDWVQDCIPVKPGELVKWPGIYNHTHGFDLRTCTWFDSDKGQRTGFIESLYISFVEPFIFDLTMIFHSVAYAENYDGYTESVLEWKQHNFGIINGTGTVELIVTDYDANKNPTYKETVNAHVYSDTDPEGNIIELYETENNSGIFDRKFTISSTRSAPSIVNTVEGDTLLAEYSDYTLPQDHTLSEIHLLETTLVGMLGFPLERVQVSNPRVTNLNHDLIDILAMEQQFIFVSDLLSQQDTEQDFVWIMQIQDDRKRTVSLSWISGTINPYESFSPSTSWIPKDTGHYTGTFFVWEKIDNPTSLSPTVEFEFDVMKDDTN